MSYDNEDSVSDAQRIVVWHHLESESLRRSTQDVETRLEGTIEKAEALARDWKLELPTQPHKGSGFAHSVEVRSPEWHEMLLEASSLSEADCQLDQYLSREELEFILAKHESFTADISWLKTIDRYDVAFTLFSGFVASVVDILFVGQPRRPRNFFGKEGSDGGTLSNWVRDHLENLTTPEQQKALENYWGKATAIDPSVNTRLKEEVAGLSPSTHRIQGLGHSPDPIGLIVGIRNVLCDNFTAVSNDGRLITQSVSVDPAHQVQHIFEAIFRIIAHWASDITTPQGLPAPFFSLLQFFQVGSLGRGGYTLAELSRAMYRAHYDMAHFIAGCVPVLINEVLVRSYFFARRIHDGASITEALPTGLAQDTAQSIRLRRLLLMSHSTAMAINGGKCYIAGGNPLALSWAQMLACMRYALPEAWFIAHGRNAYRRDQFNQYMVKEYQTLMSY